MTAQEISDYIESHQDSAYMEFPAEFWSQLNPAQAREIVEKFGPNLLMKLPQTEIQFFEWLKLHDEQVWHDLWDDEIQAPYIVAIGILPLLVDETRGFPICDLMNNDNYYFSQAHMPDADARIFLEAVQERFLEQQPLTVAQLLAMEINLAPIDIWRFSYRHGIELSRAKKAVEQLVEDKLLIHLTETEQLSGFINF